MKFSSSNPDSLGCILAGLGYVTEDQLQKALDEQESVEVLMGKLLVADGFITGDQLEEALRIQRDLRGTSKFKRALAMGVVATRSRERVHELAQQVSAKSTRARGNLLAFANGRSNGR